MKKIARCISTILAGALLLCSLPYAANAAPTLVSPSPNSFGEIERITLNDPADVYSGGVIVVGGVEMILPKNLLIDLPANRLSLQQIFDQAPAACKALGESGLAKADRCNGTATGGIATLSAVRSNAGNVIVGDLFIQKAAESVNGVVTYINYDQGYYRVNGIPDDPATGAMVRLNDPGSRHTIQNGAGCDGGPNCSPDPRFTLDPDNYTNTFATGYPVCIPSTVSRSFTNPLGTGPSTSKANADGTGDFLCPDTNRAATLVEPPVADSRRFAPIKIGDSVLAEGNYEAVGGVRFLSAHSSTVQKALTTRNVAGQPDYLFLEEVGYEAPPYQNQRLIALLIGFTTLAPTDVDVWSLHRDPVNNAIHEFPFASVQGCDNAAGAGTCSSQGLVAAGANIFKIRYDVDFLVGPQPKLSPCSHLLASRFAFSHPGICGGAASTAKDIAVMSPVPHEIIARTGRKITSPAGSLITIDINGNSATNGEYLFPLGLNLGGLGVAEMSEVNINELFTPIPFEGIPWNLDRRLGPSGCLNAGGCEALAGAPIGSFALDPFPYSGLDPRLQANGFPNVSYIDPVFSPTTLTSSRNRMFSYVLGANFGGNATLLPYALGTFPVDPPLIPINPTPIVSLFAPATFADSITTSLNTSVVINVLDNDVAVRGSIALNSIAIATAPTPAGSGTITHNRTNGTVIFTPAAGFSGTSTFTYTVADNLGAVSQPASVTVNVLAPVASVALQSVPATPRIAGTSVIFNATATGGSGAYEFQFWLFNGIDWALVQNYSANSTWAWNTAGITPGNFTIQVNARNAGASNVLGDTKTTRPYQIIAAPAPATAVALNAIPASPQVVGKSINFLATGSGGSGSYEYEFWLFNGAVWTKVQTYSANASWTWNTTGLTPGSFSVQVNTRSAGSTSVLGEAKKVIPYVLTAPPVPAAAVTLSAFPASPQIVGSTVNFISVASGGSGSYEYEFWLSFNGGTFTKVQPYSANASWVWNTTGITTGPYTVQVNTRNTGSTSVAGEAKRAIAFTITP